jgi:hypothetical protein
VSHLDESVSVFCPNPECISGGETWHPEYEYEYQGDYPMGATAAFWTDETFLCPECATEGSVV